MVETKYFHFGIKFASMMMSLKPKIMDKKNFTKANFHHIITLIQRDDGNKKNKTLEKEARLPSV